MSKSTPNEYISNANGTISIVLKSKKHGDQHAIIDAADLELVSEYKWNLHFKPGRVTKFYALGYRLGESQTRKRVLLHRLITGYPDGVQCDHRNRDGLDCTRKNLREATGSQNGINQVKCRNPKSSQYKGVHFHKRSGKWTARIGFQNDRRYLGVFVKQEDAARAYDAAAVELFGLDRVRDTLNFPDDWPQFATGGIVGHVEDGSDSVPALLMPGEQYLTAAQVREINERVA